MTTKKVHTFCRICEPYCGLLAEVEDERIVSSDRHQRQGHRHPGAVRTT
jgi:hypothetical protein